MFEVLFAVILCVQGFSDFLFKMYLDEGKLQQLLSFSKDFPAKLGVFLESHPYLAWLHHLATQDYNAVMSIGILPVDLSHYLPTHVWGHPGVSLVE